VLQACESKLDYKTLSLSNKITIAGIFAKNGQIKGFVDAVIREVQQKTMKELLNDGTGYDRFNFE